MDSIVPDMPISQQSRALHVDDHPLTLIKNSNISKDWSQFPGIAISLPFEGTFARDFHRQWLSENWHVSLVISLLYVICVLLGKWHMSKRDAYDLRLPMTIWSSLLAVFSIIGAIRCLPEFIHVLYYNGMFASYCSSSYYHDVRVAFWYYIFSWSKVLELGDTAFIILRKQKLIALHWIHHVSTLTFAFYVIGDVPGTARWMVNMNFIIHSFMYSYYALKAMRFPISRLVAMGITLAQITQMIFGLYVNYYAFQYKNMSLSSSSSVSCDLSVSTAAAGLIIYSMFFALFINFFFTAYLKRFFISDNRVKRKNHQRNNNNKNMIIDHDKKVD